MFDLNSIYVSSTTEENEFIENKANLGTQCKCLLFEVCKLGSVASSLYLESLFEIFVLLGQITFLIINCFHIYIF